MKTNHPKDKSEVQQELENLSPMLAKYRTSVNEQEGVNISIEELDLLATEALGAAEPEPTSKRFAVIRKVLPYIAVAAASLLLFVFVFQQNEEQNSQALITENTSEIEELIELYNEQLEDPIEFLLVDEDYGYDTDYYSPAEEVIMDWAVDGTLDNPITTEQLLDAL